MNLIRKYQQFIKFGLVALSYNLFAYAIYAGLVALKCNYLLASSISFIIGILVSYFMNNIYVFEVKKYQTRAIIKFFIFYSVMLFINLNILRILVSLLHINAYFAQLVLMVLYAIFSYNVMKLFIFKK